ncbi:MAG TPA: TonB-dependent receptor [Pyrinomonadaceae bacterium]|nr:TonB-dependent receptor [Pyrinomonadaceae bacterium]
MRKFMTAALVLCLSAMTALAQSSTGDLVGSVVDQSGGAVAGANVVVTSNATGQARTVQASGEGTFGVPQLDVGTYTVRITAQGYKTFTATDLKIDIGKQYSLTATLEPGGVEENVTVVAGADVVNATSAELQTTVSERSIQELPLNGRNPLALIGLQAGTASNGATNTTINGQQSSFTNITRDGLNIQDNFIRANATDFVPDRPNVDDVGEFTVTTQNADASRGYGASQVELVTPRGSNEFHGAAFIYNRNSKFSANTFFNNRVGVPEPFLNRNQFGGRLSGPLPLPRFGEGGPSTYRGKGFFFGSYEGFRLRQSTNAERTILTSTARQGIVRYRATCGTTGQPACPAGIVNGQVLQANVLALAGLTPDPIIANRILANVPQTGNNSLIGDQLNTTGLSFSRLQNQDRESVTTRFDVEASSRQSFSFVFGWRKELLLRPDVDFATGFNATPFGFQDAKTRNLVGSWRFSPTGSLTNELRGGLIRSEPAFDRTDLQTDTFLNLPLISSPESNFEAQGRDTDYWNIQDNAVWVRGEHSFRFGGQLQFFRASPFGPPALGQPTLPTLTISTANTPFALGANQFPGGISTADLGTANGLAALLGGVVNAQTVTFNAINPTSGFVQGAQQRRDLAFENYSLYFNDAWRATPALTLNLGLRYEIFTPVRELSGLGLEPVIPAGVEPIVAALNPNGTYDFVGANAGDPGSGKFFKTDKNNIAPVVSFAWSPTFKNNFLNSVFPGEGRTVLRGGYRISYVNDEFIRGSDNAINGNAGLTQQVTVTGLSARLGQGIPAIPTPAFQVPRTFTQNNNLAANFGTVWLINPDLKVPLTQEWNVGIQREVGFQTVIELRYVGAKADNLIRGVDFNQIDVRDNGFLADFNRARSNLLNFGNPACTAAQAASTGCQQLTVFPLIGQGGLLGNATIRNQILAGTPADLALVYLTNPGIFGSNSAGAGAIFLPNPNTGVVDFLTNAGKLRYHSFQSEVRRRFAQGLQFQANYTFQRAYTDVGGVAQTNFEPLLDIRNSEQEYQIADYNAEHVFNFNGIYELPFGRGKRWLNEGGLTNAILGGFQFTSIVQIATGAPITIVDPRGTLNRAGRSGRQTAQSNLTNEQIRDLIGIYRTPCGVFWIDPSVLNLNQTNLANGNCGALTAGTTGGFGSRPFGTTPASNQVFFPNAPGQSGGIGRNIANGPMYVNWDASIIKNIPLDGIKEGMHFQIRGEAFNVLNRANFFIGNLSGTAVGTSFNINSTSFGRIGSTFAPRIVQFVGRLEF